MSNQTKKSNRLANHGIPAVKLTPESNGSTPHSDERYRDLLDSLAGAIIWEAAADTLTFTFVTESAFPLLGYPVDQWLEEPDFWMNHLHPEDRDEAVSACLAATARAEDHELQYRMVAADGREVWLRDRVSVIRDAEGRAKHLRGLMIDISGAKETEQALRRTEQRFAAAFKASPAVMAIVRASDRAVLDVNEAFVEVLGYSRLEVIGRTVPELGILARPEDRERMSHSLDQTGRIRNMELPIVTKSGDVRYTIGSSEIIEVNGETCVLSLYHDITERKRTEQELALAEQKYRGIFENAVFGVFQSTREGRFISANDAMARILGYEHGGELISQISDIGTNVHADPARRLEFARLLEEHGEVREFECGLRRKDGRQIWASLSGRLRKGASGEVLGYEGIVEDITERKSVHDERERLFAALQAERQRISNVIANVPGVVFEVRGGPGEPDQTIEFVSDYSEKMLGYSPEEWVRNPGMWDQIIHHEDRERALAEARALWERRGSGTTQYRVFHRDGRLLWLEAQSSVICDESGWPIGRRGVITDITERKAAEEAREKLLSDLEAERQRISNVISDVPGVVWEAYGRPDSASQHIDFVSEHAEDMTGYSAEEWLATPNFWLTIVHPEDRERAAAEAAAIYNSGKGGRSEFRWVTHDGRAIWVESQSTVILDESRQPIGMRGVVTDVTARKEAEEALRAAEAQLTIITDAVPALISYVDASHRYVYNNEAYRDWFNQDPEELRGKHLREVIGEKAYRRRLPQIKRLLSGESVRYEDRIPYEGGSRWVLSEGVPHRVAGRVAGFVSVISDITERKLREEEERHAREAAERRLSEEAAINRIAELLRTTLDLETLCQVAVREVTRVTSTEFGIMGVRSADEARVVCSMGVPESALEPFQDLSPDNPTALARALFEGRATFSPRGRLLSGSIKFLRESGASRFAVVPLIARGAVVGALEVAGRRGRQWSSHDKEFMRRVADHIALAVSNAQAFQSIEEAYRRRDEGVRALSHEIRTPLTALKGFSQLALRHIERGPLDPERLKDSMQEIASASDRLVRVAEQMLSASSVESGITRMRKERIPLGRFLRQAVAEFTADQRPCPVRLESVPRAVLYVDPQLIRQVLWNLLGNAMRYSPQGEPVIVRATKADTSATISVIDKGPGVSPTDIERLFEKFQTGSESETGLGLGLYLARQVVEAHAGTIAYEPADGGGAIFSFTLPIRRFRP